VSNETETLSAARAACHDNEVSVTSLTTKLRAAEKASADATGAVATGKNKLDAATTDDDRARCRRDLVALDNKLHDAQTEAESLRRQLDAATAKRAPLNAALRNAEHAERLIRLKALFDRRDDWFKQGQEIDAEIGAIDAEDPRARPNRLPFVAKELVESIQRYQRELVASPAPRPKLPSTHVLVKFIKPWPGSHPSSAIGATTSYSVNEVAGFKRSIAASLELAGVVAACPQE
jgi:chromosome segregation ATPase